MTDALDGLAAELDALESSVTRRLASLREQLAYLRREAGRAAAIAATEQAATAKASGLHAVAERVAQAHRLTLAALASPSRRRRVVVVRDAAALAMRQAGATLAEIGAVLHRDHSTIVDSLRRASASTGG